MHRSAADSPTTTSTSCRTQRWRALDNVPVKIEYSAYDVQPWHEMYVMVGGASAALAGLLFVAVSINVDRIIAGQGLARRAGETLIVMVTLLVLSVFVLVPQPRDALAVESLALGVLLFAAMLGRLRLHLRSLGPAYRRVVPTVILGIVAVPLVVAGVSLLVGAGGGLYWLVPAVVLGFIGAVVNAWVLLIEILR